MLKALLANARYALLGQLVVIILGVVRATLIPFALGVTEFGYWQIYLLYAGFVGIFSLGFVDGIYLRYGGVDLEKLPWPKLRGSFYYYVLMLLGISLLLCISIYISDDINPNKIKSLYFVVANIGLVGVSSFFLFIYQITNQIKKYSYYLLVDKFVFLFLILVYFLAEAVEFEYLMFADCLSKIVLIVLMLIDMRQKIFGKIASSSDGLLEFIQNIRVGYKLLAANIASMLVLTISRFFLESYFTIDEFAIYAFGLGLTNIVIMAVNGLGVVLYPTLKRLSVERYKFYYEQLNNLIVIFSIISFLGYVAVYKFIELFMPEFNMVLGYFNLLFLFMLFQAKMQLQINTFYKLLREEQALLKANLFCILIALGLSFAVVLLFKTVYLMAFALLITMVFRVYLSDKYIRNVLKLKCHDLQGPEFVFYVVFLLISTMLPIYYVFAFLLLPIIYLIFFRTNLIGYWISVVRTK